MPKHSTGVAEAVDSLRGAFPVPILAGNSATSQQLKKELAAHPDLRGMPATRALIADLTDSPHLQMDATKAHINQRVDDVIFSVFSVDYFPSLGLDYLRYSAFATDGSLAEFYPSPTVAVELLEHSSGFDDPTVVALFPENHLHAEQKPNDLIFYFVDKFVTRHQLTRYLIAEAMVDGSFPLLSGASDSDVTTAAAWWVHLHEFHHRTGSMPIPEYLKAKSYKPLAGLEEMRVDVKSMITLLDDRRLEADMAALTFEFVFAERLLRYSVEGIPTPNYDAISSQLLFNYLLHQRALSIVNGRIKLTPDVHSVLRQLVEEITQIENTVRTDGVEHARSALLKFTSQYTLFDELRREFLHIPFFGEIKARLGI